MSETQKTMARELEAVGLKAEARFVSEVGVPSITQVESILRDEKGKAGPFKRVLRKMGIRIPAI